jgi:hypothetical protein
MSRAILLLFGALYLALGAWCLLAPSTTSRKVGLELIGATGRSEFLVVYGGLELAMGAFFLWCGLDGSLHRAGLLFALLSSTALALTRFGTLLVLPGIQRGTYVFFAVEVLMAAVAAFGFLRHWRAGP